MFWKSKKTRVTIKDLRFISASAPSCELFLCRDKHTVNDQPKAYCMQKWNLSTHLVRQSKTVHIKTVRWTCRKHKYLIDKYHSVLFRELYLYHCRSESIYNNIIKCFNLLLYWHQNLNGLNGRQVIGFWFFFNQWPWGAVGGSACVIHPLRLSTQGCIECKWCIENIEHKNQIYKIKP